MNKIRESEVQAKPKKESMMKSLYPEEKQLLIKSNVSAGVALLIQGLMITGLIGDSVLIPVVFFTGYSARCSYLFWSYRSQRTIK